MGLKRNVNGNGTLAKRMKKQNLVPNANPIRYDQAAHSIAFKIHTAEKTAECPIDDTTNDDHRNHI